MTNNTIEEISPEPVSSFAERVDTAEYFTGVGHLNMLSGIRRDIAALVPLIILTGEEGCGKSVMGKMVAAEVRSGCIPIYFSKTADSFEDVVCVIAGKVNVVVPDMTRAGMAAAVDQIAAGIAQCGDRILLICDGAERIFLATLERIRKMMDRINRVVISMQVVLIGRPGLLDNLRQLSVCNFEEIPEKRYVLAPLSFSETTSYLQFCKKKMVEAESDLFTPEVIDRIYQASGGNFRKIHYLAEELCNRNSKDASFWVLLENVESGTAQTAWSRQKRWLSFLDPRRYSRRTLLVGSSSVVVAGLLMLVFLTPDEQQSVPAVPVKEEVNVAEEVLPGSGGELTAATVGQSDDSGLSPVNMEPAVGETAGIAEDTAAEVPIEVSAIESSEKPAVDTGTLPPEVDGEIIAEGQEDIKTHRQLSVEKGLEVNESLLAEAQEAVEAAEGKVADAYVPAPVNDKALAAGGAGDGAETVAATVPRVATLSPEHVKKRVGGETAAAYSERENSTMNTVSSALSSAPKGEVLYISGDESRKKIVIESFSPAPENAAKQLLASNNHVKLQKVGASVQGEIRELQPRMPVKENERIAVAAESKKIPVLNQAIVPAKMLKEDRNTFQERKAAGASWLTGKCDNKYTLQLMVLSSETAEENMKNILGKKEYSDDVNRFYIFEKKGRQQTIYVFLGEYGSLAEAQVARDSVSDSLKKHKPYVLSVQEAVQKVR